MRYAEARSRIHSGDLLAWSHRGWGSWYDVKAQAVRIFRRSEYCHVGAAWAFGGRVLVLEAVRKGVRIFPLSLLLPFYWLPAKMEWAKELEAWAMSQVGKDYSEWQAVLAGIGKLDVGKDEIWQCAEFYWILAQRSGIELPPGATPDEVVLSMKARGSLECLVLPD